MAVSLRRLLCELDGIVSASRNAKDWVASLERQERERTGIKSLRVGYNKVFGYYIEVTTPNLPQVPDEYIRKQTLANAERFITPALKEYESLILNAEERIVELETTLFREVCSQVAERRRAFWPLRASLPNWMCIRTLLRLRSTAATSGLNLPWATKCGSPAAATRSSSSRGKTSRSSPTTLS